MGAWHRRIVPRTPTPSSSRTGPSPGTLDSTMQCEGAGSAEAVQLRVASRGWKTLPDSKMIVAIGGIRDSSITRVQPIFEAALAQDASGASWLPKLLAAAPRARTTLKTLVDDPGSLVPETVEASSSSKASLACFEKHVPPDRRLLAWCVENPERLTTPSVSDPPKPTQLKRRSLVSDQPPGSRGAVQREARECVATASLKAGAWWRFERETEVDCVLATDRLVLCIEGKRNEGLSRSTTWLRDRNQVARNLEAAWRLAGVDRDFAVLVCVEKPGDPLADPAFVSGSLEAACPHLLPAERRDLANAYLGELTWPVICQALGLDPRGMPDTIADLPATGLIYPRARTMLAGAVRHLQEDQQRHNRRLALLRGLDIRP